MSIVEFIKKRYCDTTTVMINMDEYEETYNLALDEGILDLVGLHLNITKGFPITHAMKECSVFCNNGQFGVYKSHKTKRFLMNRNEKVILEKELRAQIERYINVGYKGMFIDSHQGIHMDWSVYPIVLKLAKEYGFKKIRRSPNLSNNVLKKLIRLPYDVALKNSSLYTTKFMGSIFDYKQRIKKIKNDNTVEIMVHPQIKNEVPYIDVNTKYLLSDYKAALENRF